MDHFYPEKKKASTCIWGVFYIIYMNFILAYMKFIGLKLHNLSFIFHEFTFYPFSLVPLLFIAHSWWAIGMYVEAMMLTSF